MTFHLHVRYKYSAINGFTICYFFSYHPRDASMNSETFHYKRGVNQTFPQATHIVEPAKFPKQEWMYKVDKEVIPVVIQCVIEDEGEKVMHVSISKVH